MSVQRNLTIPKQMNLTSFESDDCVTATSNSVQFPPDNSSSFTCTETSGAYIRIPIKGDEYTWLNGGASYLSFTLTNRSSREVVIDTNIYSIFARVKLRSGAQDIHDINNYNNLYHLLYHIQGSDDLQRINTIVGGEVADSLDLVTTNVDVAGPPLSAGDVAVVNTDAHKHARINVIRTVTATIPTARATDGTQLAVNGSSTFCVQLMLPFLTSGKYIPLGFLNGNLLIEIYLETAIKALKVPSTGNAVAAGDRFDYTVSDINYNACLVHILDTNVNNQMQHILKTEGLKLQCDNFISYQQSNPANTTEVKTLITDTSQCLKGVITAFNIPPHRESMRACSYIQAYNFGCTKYSYKIGNSIYPTKGSFDSFSEAFVEAVKVFSGIPFSLKTTTLCDNSSWSTSNIADKDANGIVTGGGGRRRGTFCMACDTETIADNNNVSSGINMSSGGMNLSFSATIRAVNFSLLVNSWTHSEMQIIILPNGSLTIIR